MQPSGTVGRPVHRCSARREPKRTAAPAQAHPTDLRQGPHAVGACGSHVKNFFFPLGIRAALFPRCSIRAPLYSLAPLVQRRRGCAATTAALPGGPKGSRGTRWRARVHSHGHLLAPECLVCPAVELPAEPELDGCCEEPLEDLSQLEVPDGVLRRQPGTGEGRSGQPANHCTHASPLKQAADAQLGEEKDSRTGAFPSGSTRQQWLRCNGGLRLPACALSPMHTQAVDSSKASARRCRDASPP